MQATSPDIDSKSASAASTPREGKSKMSMALINFWLDAALFVNLIVILWISAMLQFVFPPATDAAGWSLWRLSYNEWRSVQFYAVCVFAALAVEHLVLHWNWICSVIATQVLRSKNRPDEAEQAVYGVGTFIVALVTLLATLIAALATVSQPGR